MQGVRLSKSRKAKQADIVLGLCCVPGYFLCRSAVKPNSLPSLPPSPFTSSQLHRLFCHLSFVHGLPPSAFVSHCTSFPPQTKLRWCVVSSLLLLFTGGPICSASPLEQRLPYCEFVQCPPHKHPNAIWAPLVLRNQPSPCIGTALSSLPHGCNKVILAPAADAVSKGPAEITAHTGAAWLWASSSSSN